MCAPTGETPPHKFVTPWKRLWTIAMTTGRDQSRIERPISALVSYFYCYINYFANVAKKMTTLFGTKDPRQQFSGNGEKVSLNVIERVQISNV